MTAPRVSLTTGFTRGLRAWVILSVRPTIVMADESDKVTPTKQTSWWQLQPMSESDPGHRWILKGTIAAIIFPALLIGFMQPWKLVMFGLAAIVPTDQQWTRWLGWCAAVVGVILPALGAFSICRLIWPKSPTSGRAS